MRRVLLALALLLAAAPLAAQPRYRPPPVPPPPSLPGTPAYEEERARYEWELREACYSEAGVRILMEDWPRLRPSAAALARNAVIQQELAEAGYGDPVDVARLEHAIRANEENQAQGRREYNERAIALLRRLSPADRAIYARRFSYMQPATPPRRCPPQQPARR